MANVNIINYYENESKDTKNTARLLVQESVQFLNCARQLEEALNASDTDKLKQVMDVVNNFNRLSFLVGIIKETKQPSLKVGTIVNKKRKQFKTSLKKEQVKMIDPSPEEETSESRCTEFMQRFESIMKEFTETHNVSYDAVWRPMLLHALPDDEVKWVNENLNECTDWPSAKELYQQHCTKHAITQKQERYVEYLLQLRMKEFDSLREYNQKFGDYSKNACMDLNDPSLFKRYINSLLPHYRSLLSLALQSPETPPRSLYDVMSLLDHSIYQNQSLAYASPLSCDDDLP